MGGHNAILELELPNRSQKPRHSGLTVVIDTGSSTANFSDSLRSHSGLIDFVKFGWGTSLVTKDLETKIAVLNELQIPFFFGGTLFEKALSQGKVEQYKQFCRAMGAQHVEISNGTIDIAPRDKAALIANFAGEFQVLSEVGFKDQLKSRNLPPVKWVEAMRNELDAGAWKVITEARESGNSGICRANGEVRYGLILEFLDAGLPIDRIIFEAPNKTLQGYFIKLIGPDVNLANIHFTDVVGVETFRLGLRFETFDGFNLSQEGVPITYEDED